MNFFYRLIILVQYVHDEGICVFALTRYVLRPFFVYCNKSTKSVNTVLTFLEIVV